MVAGHDPRAAAAVARHPDSDRRGAARRCCRAHGHRWRASRGVEPADPAPTAVLGDKQTPVLDGNRAQTGAARQEGHDPQRRVRRCGDRPATARGRDLHLRWRQTGEVFGHLTIGKQPIADAPITLSWTIPGRHSGTNVLATNAHGRFTMLISGPSKILTLSYSPPPGQLIAVTKRIDAAASVSLHVSTLRAGRRAHFYGVVRGGYIPENLYVEFSYLAGSAGWQPFAQPTLVDRAHGHWNTHIRIPAAAAGYLYEIKASVLPTPTWPWAHTESRMLSRYVS
jgi:hypothetical protein